QEPRAPSQARWSALTEADRREVIRLLPSEVPWELAPPEGDPHRKASASVLDTLDNYFRSRGRRVYLSSNLAVYYPEEPRFAPDLIAVLDVAVHDRMKWVVSQEGKGLDWPLEVLVHGSEQKDLGLNVERFARLGIPEYFVLDVPARRLYGYRLPAARGAYQSIVPQQGRWRSDVLQLGLAVAAGGGRFYAGAALVLDTAELGERADSLLEEQMERVGELYQRAEAEAQLAEAAAQRDDAAAQRAENAGRELQDLREELARL